ncbi:MAG: PAS domain S-box protein [Bacteroidota bacterium]
MTDRASLTDSIGVQAMFELILESLPDAVLIVDGEGRISKLNSQVEKMFGYARDELLGEPVEILVPDSLKEAHIERRGQYNSAPHVRPMGLGMELLGKRKDGTEFPVEISLSPFGMGKAISVISIVRDISERKRAEELLRTQARQQAVAVELGQLALAGGDLDFLVTEAAQSVAGTLDVKHCAVLELFPESNKFFLRAGVGWKEGLVGRLTLGAKADSEAAYAFVSKKPVVVEDLEAETRFRVSSFLREHGIVSTVNVIIPGEKQPFGVLGAHATQRRVFSKDDIHFLLGVANLLALAIGRKGGEEVLRKLSSIVESSDDGIISETIDGIILSWNPGAERIYGYSRDEVIGKHVSIFVPPERQDEMAEILQRIRRGDRVIHYETVRRRKNGEQGIVSLTISPIRDKAANITSASIIVRDITEQRRLQEQLDRAARQRTEALQHFADSVQHAQEEERRRIARELHDDLGQRLTGMKLNLQVLEDDLPGTDGETKDKLENIKRQIDLMITEIRRISANLRPAALDDFGLTVAMQLLCKEFQKSQNAQVHFQSDSDEEYDERVRIALYRIAQEALSNIAKHTRATRVSVELSHTDRVVSLVVEDNGRGFEVEKVHRHEESPRGFGLINMRERAQLLGGSFQIRSSKRTGTRIQADLPLALADSFEKNPNTHRR